MENKSTYRAKWWQLILFGLGYLSDNAFLFFFGFVSYYLNGFLGVAALLATSFATMMRVWDAITDPISGGFIDKITTRFGKFRPFMLIGSLGTISTSYIMLHVTHTLPSAIQFPVFILLYMVFTMFSTAHNTAIRSASAILTNDPKQRPVCGMISGALVTLLYTVMPAFFYGTLVNQCNGFTLKFFHRGWMLVSALVLICMICEFIGLTPSDKPERYDTTKRPKAGLKRYFKLIWKNRALQMLVVSASTDKLAIQIQGNSVVAVMFFGIVCGNIAQQGALNAYITIPTLLFTLVGCGFIAARLGLKTAITTSSWGGLIASILLVLLFVFGSPATLAFPGYEGYAGWTIFTVLFLILSLLNKGFNAIGTSVITPMIADVTDYETYRTGEFIPGMVGAAFSFVDKFVSSLSGTLVGVLCALIGYGQTLPTAADPLTPQIKFMAIFCMYGTVIIGYICNLIALKFYPLTKEKMAEIQEALANGQCETDGKA